MTGDHIELAENGRQEATPFTRVWYAVWLVMAGAIFLGGVIPDFNPTYSLVGFPGWLSMLIGGVGVVGAVASLFGSWMPPLSSQSWRWEGAGVTLQALGWAAFAFITVWSSSPAVIPWLFGLGSVLALTARLVSLSKQEKITRHVVKLQGEDVSHVRAK